MKRICISLVILINIFLLAQAEHVPVNHKVYGFLERMSALHYLPDYDPFEIPLPRKQIAGYLQSLSGKEGLSITDVAMLKDLLTEFNFEIKGLPGAQQLFGGAKYNLLEDSLHYLYTYTDSLKNSVFINFIGEGGSIISRQQDNNYRAFYTGFGGVVRGTLLNHLGFYLQADNGVLKGDKNAALLFHRFEQNWKLNEKPEETFFDETMGYATLDFDAIQCKFGRDRYITGRGIDKFVLGENSPMFDYLSLHIQFGRFEYSFMHGKIQGRKSQLSDSITGGINVVEEKYVGYHRLGFHVSRDFSFGAGELIIYANRPVDFGYLNPFAFYKTVEHNGQDRDNSMLFFDAANNTFPGVKLSGFLLFDDIDYSKIGTGWIGNQTLWSFCMDNYQLYPIAPIRVSLQYTHIEPYVFTHRLPESNFTNAGYNMGMDTDPNSAILTADIQYQCTSRLVLNATYTYRLHGANPFDRNTNRIINVGGDIQLGQRTMDADHLHFMDGDREYYRTFQFAASYEPIINYIIHVQIINKNNSLHNNQEQKYWVGWGSLTVLL
ncbi:MAG: hypothetical protein LWX56_07520 [Ignavibacteria bacterium]|nr:hypothetical protein [Ignavibacteria bacterium]